ncbi:YjbQ family protein [Anaerotignum lactatifermentans]|uniref:YjbQ family protein n=1 Tax=Anaerotignum lactatifermentans TaxID=160404 RepID=A0ABS2GEA7_9FIRM|nr:secondary thiamine-phosphate synthase enzyme YjbQ [Anaerotignum lactatifermentans]MBM6830237.1 YjbQ family protein [Anaerotignum lactatifermentans]MBM6878839.1 YjbQ family protein [Anaerotignum lactatifermentans]MBM6951850.1 YjbQ family protein [Anaerotignum lactatifermentans]
MVVLKKIQRLSKSPEEYMNITEEVHRLVEESGVKDGIAFVLTAHTTTGIMVNEALPCVEKDISELMEGLVPVDAPYVHAHFLPDYGATGNNSQGHLKSMLMGNHCAFPVIDGKIVCGGAQEIYLVDFDGPQRRTVYVEVMGEA